VEEKIVIRSARKRERK